MSVRTKANRVINEMGLSVIMMGPPGAGKGTQATRFARERGLLKISTGDILREAVREQNPVALAAQARMDRGELVDDATMIAIVRERLMRPDANRGFVLEGLKIHQRTTKPVLEYYRERPTFRTVNGAQSPERVAHELDTMIDDAAAVGMSMKAAER